MRHLPLLCLLIASSALWRVEATPAKPDTPANSRAATVQDKDEQKTLPASASAVASDAAIITIRGLCPPSATPPKNPSPCETQITKAQFEKLADAILPNKQASRQLQLAMSYPNLLAMAQAAETRGLEKSQRFQQRIAFSRLQILSQELVRQIDEESAHIPQKEIEDYYRNHSADFESATLERIYIPNRKRLVAPANEKIAPDAKQKNSEAEMTQLAGQLRARAVAGEGFSTLQIEAYTAAGMTDVPPNSSLGQLRSNGLPPGHAAAFTLKTGEVSQVFNDPTGHYIYKLDSKQPEPLERASDEIRRILKRQHRDKAIQAIQQPVSPELNPAYFGATEKPSKPADPDSD